MAKTKRVPFLKRSVVSNCDFISHSQFFVFTFFIYWRLLELRYLVISSILRISNAFVSPAINYLRSLRRYLLIYSLIESLTYLLSLADAQILTRSWRNNNNNNNNNNNKHICKAP